MTQDPFDLLRDSLNKLISDQEKLVDKHNSLTEKLHELAISVAKIQVNVGHIVKFGAAIITGIILALIGGFIKLVFYTGGKP